MKRIIFILSCFLLLSILPLTVFAADNGGDAASSSVSITVVIPQTEPKEEPTVPEYIANKPVNYLYPVSINETNKNGRNEIIKTYELAENEKPDNISRESFILNGYIYELTDITKKETDSTDTRKHTETITLDTDTNDTGAILKLLKTTIEYKSGDGYTGILSLDISSIKVETAGTKSSSYTVTATREYPHLSSNDTSLIPKSINENGRTLTLSNIQWKTQNTVTIDYDCLPESYTAIVTYMGTAYKTVVTGYVTTAEYSGTLSKTITGKTLYKAYFTGTPIIYPIELEVVTEKATEPETETTAEEIEITTEITTVFEVTDIGSNTDNNSSYVIPILITILIAETAGFIGFIIYNINKNKNGGIKSE